MSFLTQSDILVQPVGRPHSSYARASCSCPRMITTGLEKDGKKKIDKVPRERGKRDGVLVRSRYFERMLRCSVTLLGNCSYVHSERCALNQTRVSYCHWREYVEKGIEIHKRPLPCVNDNVGSSEASFTSFTYMGWMLDEDKGANA